MSLLSAITKNALRYTNRKIAERNITKAMIFSFAFPRLFTISFSFAQCQTCPL